MSIQLSKQNIKNVAAQPGLIIPDEKLFILPERVLQFGTGVLLRGLPDYFIDKANRAGMFNGRIVVVKSTSKGGTDAFCQQDCLYTTCIRGVEDGKKIDETIINSSISRVLSAHEDWNTILQCAHDPDMQIIISNTTEVGIVLSEDDIRSLPPHSFPGKLLAFLFERYKAFRGSNESGMIIIPTELITENGTKLRSIVFELAKINKLDDSFIHWLETANHFCNSLVDRIVPGPLETNDKSITEKKLGFTDNLMIIAESFRLWAIESDKKEVKDVLSFSQADDGVVIANNIEKFRELKLRLLNGTHTFSCSLALMAGFKTVKEAMSNDDMNSYIHTLALKEIVVAITNENISYAEASNFADKVMDRFRNPYIDHLWTNITLQYSSKMKMRNIPLLLSYYNKTGRSPLFMALGFASYLLFMKSSKNSQGQYVTDINGAHYLIEDEEASYFADKWLNQDEEQFVDIVLSDRKTWKTDLTMLNGFARLVKENLKSLIKSGAIETMRQMQLKKMTVK